MANQITVKNKITAFNKSITVSGDKSLSIRWVLFSSIAKGKSKAYNLLLSEDVLAAINAIKKLGVKVKFEKNYCTIIGNGPSGYKFKKNLTIKMLQEIIVNLQKETNITICICDHQARDLLACVDKAMILSNCKILAEGSPKELVNNIDAKSAYFGDSFNFK